MSEAFKLFGKTIPLPVLCHHGDLTESFSANESCFETAGNVLDDLSDKSTADLVQNESSAEQLGQEMNRESSGRETTDSKQDDWTSNHEIEDSKDPTTTTTTSSAVDEKPETSADRRIAGSVKHARNGEEQRETNNSQEAELKKPVKILPCPRCHSMDTKFCYYNNYNVNQPRHFCKNCQRYWTAGGTMRNVPVGSGRRKNKSSSASNYRQIIVSETAQVHALNDVHHNHSLGSSSTVLTFGSDSPLCESVASVLHLSEKMNGSHRPERKVIVFSGRIADNGDDPFSGNSATASIPVEKEGNSIFQETVAKSYHQGIASELQCFPGPPWPYPWNSTFCPSGFPLSYYPSLPYWNCTVPNPWNVTPCLSPQSAASLSPTSPLGKHSREGNIINAENSEDPSKESDCSERRVLVRKTLRIDDPTEAAKRCIRATSGFKGEKPNSTGGGFFFAGFQSKNGDRKYLTEKRTCPVLQANPAALSRSLNFHENF